MGRFNPPPLLVPMPVQALTTAQRMLDAAICAYSIIGTTYQPIDFFNDPVGWGPAPKVVIDGDDNIDAGLIGQTSDGWVILSLRGTLSTFDSISSLIAFFRDWSQDDETKQVAFSPAPGKDFGKVHNGFHAAVKAMWDDIYADLSGRDWNNLQGLCITGHSKGAGMSFLCAVLAQACLPTPANGGPKTIQIHAFAAPLAGNQDFVNAYAAAGLEANTIRYQREDDIVPFLPAYTSFDLLEKWEWGWSPELDAVLELLELTYGGYALAGTLEYYPDHHDNQPWPQPMTGDAGQNAAETAILEAIRRGARGKIEDAHSAIHSYWPSIFAQKLPQGAAPALAKAVTASLELRARLLAAGD
jgi:hypothetical protein